MLKPAAAFVLVLASGAAGAGLQPANRFGMPVVDRKGMPIVYQRDDLPGPGFALGGDDPPPALRGGKERLTPVMPAAWKYPIFGSGIGASGILVLDAGAAAEIVVGGNSDSDFGADDFWQVLRWNGTEYASVWCSELYASEIERLLVAPFGSASPEIVVVLRSGRVERFEASTRRPLGSFQLPSAAVYDAALFDLDGDGRSELLAAGPSVLTVHDSAGAELWRAVVGGMAFAVGQMDADPAFELSISDGVVLDSATHSAQWTRSQAFGVLLDASDIDGDGMEELIAAEAWYLVWSFDVDRQLPKWSIPVHLDIGAIEVADVEGDGVKDLLVGDGQWGSIHSFNTVTQQEQWVIGNPEHGVTAIAVADADGDSVVEVLWGAGWTSTGEDHLYVASSISRSIEWQSVHLDGDFIGPEIGDVDGDGAAEIVTAVTTSDAGYGSGRIQVFDGGSRELLAISPRATVWPRIYELRLHNVDADPALEILVGYSWVNDGKVEAFDFDRASGAFTSIWSNDVHPAGLSFRTLDVGDLDRDGQIEVVASGAREHTGALGVFAYVYDWATRAEEWHTFQLGPYWGSVNRVAIVGGGSQPPDLVASVTYGSIWVFNGATREVLQEIAGPFNGMAVEHGGDGSRRLYAWDSAGMVRAFEKSTSPTYSLVGTTGLASAVTGLTPLAGSWLLGSAGTLSLMPSLDLPPVARSGFHGEVFGRRAAVAPDGSLYSGGAHALVAFEPSVDITGVSPRSGPAQGGVAVRILGAPLDPAADVFLGGVAAEVVGTRPGEIMVLAPPLPGGSAHDVLVANPDGTFGLLVGGYVTEPGTSTGPDPG